MQKLLRRLLGALLRLEPASGATITSEKAIETPMRDGVILRGDRYFPADAPPAPLILIRSPYGRSALFGTIAGLFVERGFQVMLQSVRGTWDSDGTLDPMRQEQADGVDTVRWVRAQPWCGDRLFTFGFSYLGNAQWALARDTAGDIDAFGLAMTLSNFTDELVSFGGFTQDGSLGWTQLMQGMVDWQPGQKMQRPNPAALQEKALHLPLGTLDEAALGKTVTWWQDWVNHDNPADPWWQTINHSADAAALARPVTLVGGWQDVFLPFQVRDFQARVAAGQPTWLTIGPWRHASPAGMGAGVRESLALFGAITNNTPPYAGRQPVRVFLQGTRRWLEFSDWPPREARAMPLHLHTDGQLQPEPPTLEQGQSTYVYDPADPTPALHGPTVVGGARKRPMAALEARADTLSFTSAAFDTDVDLVGDVAVDLAIASDTAHTDFFVVLCDVDKRGRASHICDGYRRLRPENAGENSVTVTPEGLTGTIRINCWPTAYRLRAGHRLRLIVASGAHPRYTRNLGYGDPLASATRMRKANQIVFHHANAVSCVHVSKV